MADPILTESEASRAVEDLGWRYLLDCLTTAVTVDSLFEACEVIALRSPSPAHTRTTICVCARPPTELNSPWRHVVLGYDHVHAPADLVDPSAGGPSLWFQQMDQPRTQRNRIHLDLTVPHDDAVARVEAALAAGGRLVSDDHARAFWILADSEGNEVCVCTWQDRD
jgi:4a-hydroxytetrahydrobiopterin dehydratase